MNVKYDTFIKIMYLKNATNVIHIERIHTSLYVGVMFHGRYWMKNLIFGSHPPYKVKMANIEYKYISEDVRSIELCSLFGDIK